MKYQFEPFSVEYDLVTEPVADFRSECIAAAHRMLQRNTWGLPVVVHMSGGLDSELVANALLAAGVQFTCVIGKFMTDGVHEPIVFNDHDADYAVRWCKRHDIPYTFCMLDLYRESRTLCKYALLSRGFSPQFACHMFMMRWSHERGLFFVTGNAEMDFVLREDYDGWSYYLVDEQREATLDNFCKAYKLSGTFQFCKDSRLIAAFLQSPMVKRLMDAKVPRLLDHKHACFMDAFEMEPRPKATGFERVQEWDSHLRTHLKRTNGHLDAKFYTPASFFTVRP